ncbi:MAG: response regulator transcription factor [Sporolactobacillus sp.]
MEEYSLLVVDDDQAISAAIAIYLKNEGLRVYQAKDGLEALDFLQTHTIHLILLDVMMPKLDGIQTTMRIREQKNIPIIIISAKSEDMDKILGLQVGADDYITKPFNPLELIARVKSQLRRYVTLGTYEKKDQVLELRGLVVNPAEKSVVVNGEPARLTAKEYRILELFMRHPGRVFSIHEIYERVWEEPCINAENTVAVHIRKIREKIEIDPRNPRYIKVVWGIGYKIEKEIQ